MSPGRDGFFAVDVESSDFGFRCRSYDCFDDLQDREDGSVVTRNCVIVGHEKCPPALLCALVSDK